MNKLSMRTRVLLIIIPFAFLPMLILAILSMNAFRNRLIEQSKEFYSNILMQVSLNIDYYYNSYAITLTDVMNNPAFEFLFFRPQRTSELQEKLDSRYEIGGVRAPEILRNQIASKIKGFLFTIELDRFDVFNKVPYTSFKFSNCDYVFNMEKFLETKPVKEILENPEAKPILTIFKDKSIMGYEIENCPVLLSRVKVEGKDNSSIKKFNVLIENTKFFYDIYKSITSLNYGTLFILDKYGQVMNSNHPGDNDYYDYNPQKKKYELNGLPANDPAEKMKFVDYQYLITESDVLKNPKVINLINNDNLKNGEVLYDYISYHMNNYLCFAYRSETTEVITLFFYPMYQINKPIINIVNFIISILIIVFIIILILSFIISKYFTYTIQKLSEASRIVKNGDYTHHMKLDKFFGEFYELGESFNNMISQIYQYSVNMEGLVAERTEQLNKANMELLKANEELSKAYENNKKELMMAQHIQMSLIPKIFPHSDLISFSGKYMPMEALGGDLYDVYRISDTRFGMMILDVCGHGVPAALITTMAKISFSNNSKTHRTPDKVVSMVNKEIYEAIKGSNDYLTCFYCVIDLQTKKLEYSNAGHNDMILYKANGDIVKLIANGPIVGIIDDIDFGYNEVDIEEGDRLILYTDGVIEASDINKNFYKTERLLKVIVEHRNSDSKDFIKALFDDINNFKGGIPNNDDIAVIVTDIKIKEKK